MSVSKEDVKKLAELARIEMKDEEMVDLSKEMDSILDYVGQVQKVAGETPVGVDVGPVFNVMREDDKSEEGIIHRDDIISEFPNKEGDYLKVKKIL